MWRRKRVLQDLDQEIRDHIAMATQENIDRGMSPEEARYAALRKFGNVTRVKEDAREVWSIVWLEQSLQDIRFALRILRKSPGFTCVAILTLAFGIGANTAIFELLDAVHLRSLPVQHAEQLVEVRIVGGNQGIGLGQAYGELTRPLYEQIRDKQQSFSGTFAWSINQRYLGRGSEMRQFRGLWVTGNFFQVLGVQPWQGRLLMPDDETTCPPSHAVVSYRYWKNQLGGRDPRAGIQLVANNDLVQIVGVTPPKFFGMVVGNDFDIALPFCRPTEPLRRDIFEVSVIGRLKPDRNLQVASSEMAFLGPSILEDTVPPGRDPDWVKTYKDFRLAAYPAQTGVSSLREYDRSLYFLLGIAGLVLLIACANLASLMLARASSRQSEIAVRLALGASRGRILRQLLAESVLLAATGAAIAIGLANFLSRVLVWAISSEEAQVSLEMAADWRVLFFVSAVATLTCIFFGMVPVVRATRTEPLTAMKSGGRGATTGREGISLQKLMVVTQISVSVVLLVGALLFVRSFRNLITSDPGMREHGISIAFLGYWQSQLPAERWGEYGRELLDEVHSVPGVLSAANTTNVPLAGETWEHAVFAGSHEEDAKFTWVSPGYFETMGIPVIKGRDFTRSDTASSPRVAVVNNTFVQRFLPSVDPIGQSLRTEAEPNYPSTVYDIVGVISDTRYNNLRNETPPMAFAPSTQNPQQGPWLNVMIHSNAPTSVVASAVKLKLAEKHSDVLAQFVDFQQQIRDQLVEERLMAMLSGFFGALAALLTMIGVYGVISYMVASRRNEIGIRMALGASRWNVVRLVLRQTLVALTLGVAIGIPLALVATRGAATILYGLQPNDLLTYAAAIALLIVISLAGSFLPARRATRVDPMVALRYE